MKMPKWVGWVVCKFKGHLRGRRARHVTMTFSEPNVTTFECPRCGALWSRKVYARKPKAAPAP